MCRLVRWSRSEVQINGWSSSWDGVLDCRAWFGVWLLVWDGRFWGDGEGGEGKGDWKGGAGRVVELEMFCYG